MSISLLNLISNGALNNALPNNGSGSSNSRDNQLVVENSRFFLASFTEQLSEYRQHLNRHQQQTGNELPFVEFAGEQISRSELFSKVSEITELLETAYENGSSGATDVELSLDEPSKKMLGSLLEFIQQQLNDPHSRDISKGAQEEYLAISNRLEQLLKGQPSTKSSELTLNTESQLAGNGGNNQHAAKEGAIRQLQPTKSSTDGDKRELLVQPPLAEEPVSKNHKTPIGSTEAESILRSTAKVGSIILNGAELSKAEKIANKDIFINMDKGFKSIPTDESSPTLIGKSLFKDFSPVGRKEHMDVIYERITSSSDSINTKGANQVKTSQLLTSLIEASNKVSENPITQTNTTVEFSSRTIGGLEALPQQQSQSTQLSPSSNFHQGLALKSDFSPNLAMRIQWIYQQAISSAEILMDPPDLGPLSVKMQHTGSETSLIFQVSNPQTKEMIEDNLSKLRELLAEQGITLGDTQVQQNQKDDSPKPETSELIVNEESIDELELEHGQVIEQRIGILDTYI